MAVLYPKYFLCSMRCLSCIPLTISLQPLRCLQFSPLSSSSFPSAPSLNVVSDFLTKESGFSSSQATTVMRRKPRLLRHKSDQTAREAIHMLKDYGFTEDQLKSAILRNPTILTLKVDAQLKPRMEFLKNLCLAPEDMPVIISRCPRLFDSSFEKCLAPNILHLRSLFGSKDDLCKAVRWAPQFLTSDFKKHVVPRVEYVKNNLGIPDGSAAFVRVLGVVLRLSFETLEEKTENLASLGLAAEEIRLILRGNPKGLQSSTKKIKENMDFFIHTAGLMPEIVASHPKILNFSVEKTLKPRFEFFKYLQTNPHCKSPPSLVGFFTLSEKRLLKYYGQYRTQVKSNDYKIS
ncbi:transcription termination factor MTERF6, chloroplastic/mitochondrial [Cryptomeria japonica]|uniref:transcription termination factor MTERF6, chloroplastic/mitochondrial n=1 Tax=Cryptomeria japonica TaxID=3369 RepID=UPI0027DA55F9|nr:transcription termination factor MTERF6, chloroplastic/mitochondrial [Cryptomeria japonica]